MRSIVGVHCTRCSRTRINCGKVVICKDTCVWQWGQHIQYGVRSVHILEVSPRQRLQLSSDYGYKKRYGFRIRCVAAIEWHLQTVSNVHFFF